MCDPVVNISAVLHSARYRSVVGIYLSLWPSNSSEALLPRPLNNLSLSNQCSGIIFNIVLDACLRQIHRINRHLEEDR